MAAGCVWPQLSVKMAELATWTPPKIHELIEQQRDYAATVLTVDAVADFWRSQGEPDYISAVTEEPEDGGFSLDGAPEGDDSPEEQLYRRAVQLVAESQKASTSWLQRQLRVGYNSAARLIEPRCVTSRK